MTEAAPNRLALYVGHPSLTDPAVRSAALETVPLERQAFDLEIIHGDANSVASARAALLQLSFGAGRRCVWLRSFDDSDPREVEGLLELVEQGWAGDNLLVVSTAKIDRRTRLYQAIARAGSVRDLRLRTDRMGRFEERAVSALIIERLKANGRPAPNRAVLGEIMSRAGSDEGQLLQELDKLCLVGDAGRALTVEDVKALMNDAAEASVFELTDAISARQFDKAQLLVEEILAGGTAPQRLCAVLATHIASLYEASRHLGRLQHGDLRGGIPEFERRVWDSLPQPVRNRFGSVGRAWFLFKGAAAFGLGELLNLHGAVAKLDRDLKGSGVEPRLLFSGFVGRTCVAAR
ncbi:MAG: DNA polymerase III subunit delta [Candidatus Binatia bacterium]